MKRRDSSGVACGPSSVVAGSPGTIDGQREQQQHRADHDQHGRDEAAPEIAQRLVDARRASREHRGLPPTPASQVAAPKSSYCQSIQPGTPAGVIQLRWTSVLVSLVSQT